MDAKTRAEVNAMVDEAYRTGQPPSFATLSTLLNGLMEQLEMAEEEHHDLLERTGALEWLVEVEDAKDYVYWSHDSSDDSWDEYIEIHSCARRKAGFPPLEPKKKRLHRDAIGLKEAGV